ncbi:MAG: tetratricopeptide repeat protein [Bacteroidaceae bacterium]|nr:tetratricopeptide repeat protein [Bacteroidaceae bacterium]
MKKLFILTILSIFNIAYSTAQLIDYGKEMDEIMSNYIDDYPEKSIRAFDKLFDGVDVSSLSVETRFFYYYYLGGCYSDANRNDDAIRCLIEALKIASSSNEVGVRNVYALEAESLLADLYMSKNTEEDRTAALLLYNDIITIGVSLINNADIGLSVVTALIEEAKAGATMWKEDPEWVKKIWIQARDLAIEINDSTAYSYYVLNVLNYYCNLGEYDIALDFMEDAKNKEILVLNASAYCNWIKDIRKCITQRELLKTSKGINSLDYWSNELEIATKATVLYSNDVSIKMLQDVEAGLKQYKLTASYQYAQVIMLLADKTFENPVIGEQYFMEQVNILKNTPQFFIYITDIDTYSALGICQMKLGKYNEADENYRKALACLERDIASADLPGYKQYQFTIYHNMGRNLFFMGNYEESIAYFKKSIELQENMSGSALPKTKIYLAESLEYINIK